MKIGKEFSWEIYWLLCGNFARNSQGINKNKYCTEKFDKILWKIACELNDNNYYGNSIKNRQELDSVKM